MVIEPLHVTYSPLLWTVMVSEAPVRIFLNETELASPPVTEPLNDSKVIGVVVYWFRVPPIPKSPDTTWLGILFVQRPYSPLEVLVFFMYHVGVVGVGGI